MDITICYDYGLKSALFVDYSITRSMVEAKSLDERLRFYDEPSIPSRYRTSYSFYKRSGFDRGHIANDSSFDYAEEDLFQTYSMANIIPQDPVVNRKIWIKAEKYERLLALKLGSITVLNGVVFNNKPKRIRGMAVPSGFWKKLTNKSNGFEKCFYFDNFFRGNVGRDKLRDHLVNCNTLKY
jgi:endonuclease G